MQQIACPLCESPDAMPVATMRDRLLGLEGEFNMVRCNRCGLHYLNPQPTRSELARYYPEEYDPFQAQASPAARGGPALQRWSVEYGLAKRCRAIARYKDGGRLLEIGCANGLFLDAMRRRGGWQLEGVEVSAPAAGYAREELGLDVFCGSLQDAEFPAGRFDAVVMWDVLEHVHQPRETLVEIRRVLKPDGVFVFRLPLLDAWERRLFGPYWAGWDAPRHLTLFSRETLALMLDKAGFRIEETACIAGSYPAFVLSMRFWAGEHLSPAGQRRLRRLLEALPARVLTAPLFYLVDRLERGTVVTVVARPER
jgi:SAM-dependent methyltransferase